MGNSSSHASCDGTTADGTLAPNHPVATAASSSSVCSAVPGAAKPAKPKNVRNRMLARFGQHRKTGGKATPNEAAAANIEADRFVVVGGDGARPKRPSQLAIGQAVHTRPQQQRQREQLCPPTAAAAAARQRNAAALAVPESGSESSADDDGRFGSQDAVHGECRCASHIRRIVLYLFIFKIIYREQTVKFGIYLQELCEPL